MRKWSEPGNGSAGKRPSGGPTLTPSFKAVVEGALAPAVAVVAFPSGSMRTEEGAASENPVLRVGAFEYTGEYPAGRSELQPFFVPFTEPHVVA
jgi:hypothetical protein